MRAVKASAKTREEAIEKALGELGVEMYEVDKIEIIDEGSKGIFGFGARPVEVSVIVENLPDEPRRSEDEGERRGRSDGKRGGRGRGQRGDGEKRQERKPRAEQQAKQQKSEKDGNRPPRDGRKGKPARGRGKGGDQPQAAKADAQGPKKREENRKPEPARNESRRDDAIPTKKRTEGPEEDVSAAITDDQGREAAALLEEIIAKMELSGTVEFVRTDDGSARLNVTSEDGAILIGRKGRNLNAMQYIINRIISSNDTQENTERLVVDVEGYVDRRRASLEDMAKNFAAKAKSTGRNMRLKPLSPQERRIIHLTLENDPELRTYSLGDSLFRSVVISPKDAKNDRPQQERSRGGRGRRGRGGRNRGGGGGGKPAEQDSDIDAGTFGD